MKVATILPQAYLDMTEKDDYLMALAHLIDSPGMSEYTSFFMRKAKEEGTFIIMDNGVIEGDPRPIEELVDKALLIGASELVLPDVFRNSEETLRVIEEATMYLATQHERVAHLGFMAVPQGNSLEEWVDCAVKILDNPIVTCIGVPKVLVDIAGRDGRYFAIHELIATVGDLDVDIHLLGCWQTPLELTIIAKGIEKEELPEIRGVDSAIAYVYARAGIKLNADDRPDNDPVDFVNGKLSDDSMLYFNIRMWRDCVDLRKDKKMHFI
jgi:hypothetical protein